MQSAGCIVLKAFNGEFHILMAHSAGNWNNKKFGFPKGQVEKGESLGNAARRETFEEVGIEVDILDYLGYVEKKDKTVYAFIGLYKSGPLNYKSATKLQVEEIDVAKFYPIDECIKISYSYQKPLFEKAKKYVDDNLR